MGVWDYSYCYCYHATTQDILGDLHICRKIRPTHLFAKSSYSMAGNIQRVGKVRTGFAWITIVVFSPGLASPDYDTSVSRVWLALCGERCNHTLLSTNVCGHNLTNTIWMSLMQIQCLKIYVTHYWLFITGFRIVLYYWDNTHQLYFCASQPADTYTPWGVLRRHKCFCFSHLSPAPNKGEILREKSIETPSIISWGRFITAKTWSILWGTLHFWCDQQD